MQRCVEFLPHVQTSAEVFFEQAFSWRTEKLSFQIIAYATYNRDYEELENYKGPSKLQTVPSFLHKRFYK
jgi:hypothetical protein